MKLTEEQQAILASQGDIKINAVAGSGKTTTLIAYASSRPSSSKILYLAFNRSVKDEAITRFQSEGLSNVHIETAHSLAFRHVIRNSAYTIVEGGGYRSKQIADVLALKKSAKKHAELILATHVNKLVQWFCHSAVYKVQELNYLETITEKDAKAWVIQHYDQIVHSS